MTTDSGRLPGSRASMEPASGLHPSGFDPSRWLELAERCEAASGPSPHLDVQIFILLEPDAQHIVGHEPGRFPQKSIYGPRSSFWDWATDESLEPPALAHPKFTASLDAALTLVPDGATWELTSEGSANVLAPIPGEPGWFTDEPAQALTAPLAVCAAALRARAAIAMEARQRRDAEERPDPKDDSAGRRHRPTPPSLQTPQGGDS